MKEVAFGHPGHVVLVEEVAVVTLLTQPPQPVLAHRVVVRRQVPERAQLAPVAHPHAKQTAHRCSRFCIYIVLLVAVFFKAHQRQC